MLSRLSCISLSKWIDLQINDQRPILHMSSNTFHQRKCFVLWSVISSYLWGPSGPLAMLLLNSLTLSCIDEVNRVVYLCWCVKQVDWRTHSSSYTQTVSVKFSASSRYKLHRNHSRLVSPRHNSLITGQWVAVVQGWTRVGSVHGSSISDSNPIYTLCLMKICHAS